MRFILLSAVLSISAFAQPRAYRAPAPAVAHAAPTSAPRPIVSRPITSRPTTPRPTVPRVYQPRPIYVPYPVFIGGGYYGSPSGYTDQAPIAVVNQDFRPDAVNPSLVDYSNIPLPEPVAEETDENGLRDDQPTIFLIALTDHTVLASIAYWVEGDTLHWISRDAKQNSLSLSLIDRDFSKQLNDERHVEFKLPAVK